MHPSSRLQFRLMTPEAQRAAIQRLALRGMDIDTICRQTGLSAADVQRCLTGMNLQRESWPWRQPPPRWPSAART